MSWRDFSWRMGINVGFIPGLVAMFIPAVWGGLVLVAATILIGRAVCIEEEEGYDLGDSKSTFVLGVAIGHVIGVFSNLMFWS